MRTLIIMVLVSSIANAASEKIFIVNGKTVTPKEALLAGMKNEKVQRCGVVDAEFIVDGKPVKNAMKCQDVVLFSSKSGLPTWKNASQGARF